MSCDVELKYLLDDFVRGTLPEPEAALVREHLNACPDCREDLEQIKRLSPLLAAFAEGHVPADSLVYYHHNHKEGLAQSEAGFWNRAHLERHLDVCDQCQTELEKLAACETDFRETAKPTPTEPSVAKPPAPKRYFLPFRKIWYAGAAAAALILFFVLNPPLRSQGPMVAVLPFEFAGPTEKEFFAEGLSNEITAALEKVGTLGVISPSSAARYKNTEKEPGQIGKELGVDYLLTGIIRWDTTGKPAKLRVIPRLLLTEKEAELWTEPFEIVWGEICNLPGAITRKVISALNVEFLEPEHKGMENCPTGNIEAYEYYLRGNISFKELLDIRSMQKALQMYSKAVELDSGFALACAMLSRTATEIYWHHLQGEKKYLTLARHSVDKAFGLQSELPEARLALGSYYYHNLEIDSALEQLKIAQTSLPGNSDLLEEMGYALVRKGEWGKGVKALENAFKLDPRDAFLAFEIGQAYHKMRKYPDAENYYAKARSLFPEPKPSFLFGNQSQLYIEWYGSFDKANQRMREILGISDALFKFHYWEEAYKEELGRLTLTIAKTTSDSLQYYYLKATIYWYMKKPELMHAYFDSARPLLEPLVQGRPESGDLRSQLGIVYAGLGRKEEAIREAKKAAELVPMSKDAANFGPTYVFHLARTYVMLGEYDKALDQIEYLLSVPSDMSINRLRLHPDWAPLRSLPRFQKLLKNPPPVSYSPKPSA